MEALDPGERSRLREWLGSSGLTAGMLIGDLADGRTASDWAASDWAASNWAGAAQGRGLARAREQFRRRLLEILASDETSWVEPEARRFFGQALAGGRRNSAIRR